MILLKHKMLNMDDITKNMDDNAKNTIAINVFLEKESKNLKEEKNLDFMHY